MKRLRIITIAIFTTTICLLISCSEMRLKATVAVENAKCPIRIDDNIVMTEIKQNGNYIEFVCDFEDGYRDKDGFMIRVADLNDDNTLKKLKNVMMQAVINTSPNNAEAYQEVIELCKSCEVGISCRLVGSRTQDECVVKIDYWELP